MPIRRSKINKL